ncbi:TniQ family protein [Rhodoblastus acidophilus]|uniref:TniQ family protein n=1 Tax=Candidatus Rhodoblastus alkanivorans TaxID=2954117 RepID=A0ABS9Z3I3_9HYPH|nr:TniQ family protein [Candidatus Rhodoblastus alkanivorans]MCI4679008.1 TniQ family protein [Candidatus Rhodoblastus alkanivorans]MCI4681737.1 TniQ family protein [Candidatus Rhodoblastus alkanivorans]MDI4642786.1 TniQ family protein [Rhodoblastus acidophilus]
MRRRADLAIEVQPRLATILPERWPVEVPPAHDELLSSWLHRLALAHGLSPRHFGERLGVGSNASSARLDLAAPAFLLNILHHQTGVGRESIAAMTIGSEKWRPLLLPMRRSRADRTFATWLQFCPTCLAEDENPYFRRAWRRASVMTCRRHRRPLLDRCPSCGQSLAPFNQRALVPQCQCAVCGFDLRRAAAPNLTPATRKAAELIDDFVRLEAAKGFLQKSALIARIIALPSLQEPPSDRSFIRLSTAERIRCVASLERGWERPLQNHLCAEPDAVIAGWRRMIVAAGGTTPALEPLLRRLPIENEGRPRTRRRKSGAPAADLPLLLSAYGAVRAQREFRKRGG